MTKFSTLVGIVLCSTLLMGSSVFSQSPKTLDIENEFIKLSVNAGPQAQGRFAIETTMGNPDTPNDDHQSLVFGRPVPWTSYSTLLIDGHPYVFGGVDEKTQKRAGTSVQFGVPVVQVVTAEGIVTEYKYDKISVVQKLSFFRNPSTKVNDSAMITYEVMNTDSVSHEVGLRVMMDTKLGENDGAPFRIGAQAITDEARFSGPAVLDYWQAFDSLTSPNIVAQGLLRLPQAQLTPPDDMILGNWGTLSDNPWTFEIQPGRSFVREGELEKDTALALFWRPVTIPPGHMIVRRTVYGLGGVSIASGALSLGLTAPVEAYPGQPNPVMVVLYVTNTSGFDAQQVKIHLDVPDGFVLVEGKVLETLPKLEKGKSVQYVLRLKPKPDSNGDQLIKFKVSSSTLESNHISRKITILGAPVLNAAIEMPPIKLVTLNVFTDAYVRLNNPSSTAVEGVEAVLQLTNDSELPAFESLTRSIPKLLPGQSVTLNWKIKVRRIADQAPLPISVQLRSVGGKASSLNASTTLVLPKEEVRLIPSDSFVALDDFVYVWLESFFGRESLGRDYVISYDPDVLRFERLSPEPWIEASNQVSKMVVSPGEIHVNRLDNRDPQYEQRIAKFHFKTLKSGQTRLKLKWTDREMSVTLNVGIGPKF